MKKILALCLIASIALTAEAQRFGTTPNNDNTYRGMTIGLIATPTTATTTDTININPGYFYTYVTPSDSVKGTVIYIQKTVSHTNMFGGVTPVNYLGDKIQFTGYASKIGTPVIKFRNKYNKVWQFADSTSSELNGGNDSTIVLKNGKYYSITFTNDGTYWDETDPAKVGK